MLLLLPGLCMDCICAHLAHTDDFRGPSEVARDAAALSLTSLSLLQLGTSLYSALCPAAAVPPGNSSLQAREQHLPASGSDRYWCPVPPRSRFGLVRSKWLDLHTVSKRYLLKPADRTDVRQTMRFDGGRYGTRLWLARDVYAQCLSKFGGERGWAAECARLQRRRDAAAARLRAQRQRRQDRLVAALAARGCQLRADSSVCQAFVDDGEGDPEHIATVMEEMQFFFEHTAYAVLYDEDWEHQRQYEGWADRGEVSAVAKQAALSAWARQYPSLAVAIEQPQLPQSLRSTVHPAA
jgi:hypothetical protein